MKQQLPRLELYVPSVDEVAAAVMETQRRPRKRPKQDDQEGFPSREDLELEKRIAAALSMP